MTEKKTFDCPSCGRPSTFDPATITVEHSEPHCEAWKAKQLAPSDQQVTESAHATVTRLAPSLVVFDCPECNRPARMHPRSTPLAVEHSLPVCKLWAKIEGKKDDVERYLIKAGVHIYAPQHELPAGQRPGDAGADDNDAGAQK